MFGKHDSDGAGWDDAGFDDAYAAEPPPHMAFRFVGALLIALSIVVLLSLVCYDSADIPCVSAPASVHGSNPLGLFGAFSAYLLLMTFGLASYALPLAGACFGVLMMRGIHLRYRPFWLLLLMPGLCALFQFANGAFAELISSQRMNIAPNAGGALGGVLNNPQAPINEWLGSFGSVMFYVAVTLGALVLLFGPRTIGRWIASSAERRRRMRDAVDDSSVTVRPDLEEDIAQEREARETAAERRRAEREEKLRLKEEAKAEKQRLKEEAKAEKLRLKEEARAARKRKDDSIFDDDPEDAWDAPEETPEEREESPAPAPKSAPSRGLFSRKPVAPPAMPDDDEEEEESAEAEPEHVEFELPSIVQCLNEIKHVASADNSAEIEERSRIIEQTLAEFGLQVAVTNVVAGPVITRYEVKPAPGVRVDKIASYHNNLQMSLRAQSLRIISPIPGKDVMGIEVPNINKRPVLFRAIAESPAWKAAAEKTAIPLLLGEDIDGAPVVADLAKMPHMIVAGATGSGKSVCLNSILSGIMLSRTPDEVRLILVDPKMVEFTPYASIPHLVVPVITEAPKVAVCLQWAVAEMNKRLKLFKEVGVRNISSYNSRFKGRQATIFGGFEDNGEADRPEKLPYIVIVIDEMSDLMMLAGADVEPRIVRLAQLARAVGIHLIIATQRPDVKVITGKIKANFPARIAFKVVGAVNSVTILDQAGAETLVGNGDMLFMNPAATGILRAQGCWITDEEIASLVAWYRRQQSEPVFVSDIKEKLDRIKVKAMDDKPIGGVEDESGEGAEGEGGEDGGSGEEAFLQKCLDVIVAEDRASTSMLQRKLRLGYNRAARVMDQLEELGCIGPSRGASPRDILRTRIKDDSLGGDAPAEDFSDTDGDDNA